MLPEQVDVAVIGAGPAGASCASELAAHGYDVALIDKEAFPRDKTCGDGLTPHALTALRKLGLDALVEGAQRINGCRIVMDHRREHLAHFDHGAPGACLRRSVLDEAIVDVARDRGAQFVNVRAIGIRYDTNGETGRVRLATKDGEQLLKADRIVAADGPTSVLRQSAGLGSPGHAVKAFAIRGYFSTERALDELFDVYVPLEAGGATLMGYGWVFRVDEHVANIGVGYFRPRGGAQLPPLNVALETFVAELIRRQQRRFGDIAALARPSGSPLGLNFEPMGCTRGNLLLIGDAAGITDPFTGEGIALAIDTGMEAAQRVHASLAHGTPVSGFGLHLARRLTRSGQNYSSISRIVYRRQSHADLGAQRIKRLGLLSSAISIAADMNLIAEPGETSVEIMLKNIDGAASEVVTALHQHLLDSINTAFPFIRALISRQIRLRGGPVYAAALVLTVQAYEKELPLIELARAGRAAECLVPFHIFLGELGDHTSGELEKLSNALAVLAADFAVSQAVCAVSQLTGDAAMNLALTVRDTCEAGMIDMSNRYDLTRHTECYISTAEKGMGSTLAFAAGLGAELAGATVEATREMRRYGERLGVAQRILSDVAELERVDESRSDFARSLRFGRYGLPMLLAFDCDRSLRRTVTAGPTRGELGNVVERVRATGALDEACEIANGYVEGAKAAMRSAGPPVLGALDDFADWISMRDRPVLRRAI
jgi:geranylgeranyl reductase family protein